MAGVTGTIAPSGELSAGNISISGQRESANGFLVNGSDVQEHMNGGTGVVPDLDSIAEFRVLTNNFASGMLLILIGSFALTQVIAEELVGCDGPSQKPSDFASTHVQCSNHH
jgi:hypothetical protein